jgi:hypothetical protein
MAEMSDSPLERLWSEYAEVFREFDDLTLARWMSQTLSQLQGRLWRFSHPLLGAYRLASQVAHERQIWLKRLANAPASYAEAPCCRAPMLPLFTRDIVDSGLVCQHCANTAVPFEDLSPEVQALLQAWSEKYKPIHAVAHWDDDQRKSAGDYDRAFDQAAAEAEKLLVQAGRDLLPRFLETYPALVWEDQDECLEVRPEDIQT